MKRKHKFYFNPVDLVYVRHRPTNWERLLRVGGILASTFLVAVLAYSVFIFRHTTPGEKALAQEVNLYKKQVEILNSRIQKVNASIAELETRDNEVYRVIFEAKPTPVSVAIGGAEKYKDIQGLTGSEAIIETNKKLDEAFAKTSVLEQSYKELIKLAKNKKEFLASMPAIQPISNQYVKQIGSGFGYRLHPIYKHMQMHTGIDFNAKTGTPIYATGDGVVQGYDPNGAGYGLHIIINHGFGYATLYGHMSKVIARAGQKVKRGQLIGLVGSTGLSTAPHLHYEVMRNGQKTNPVNYFHNDLSPLQYKEITEDAKKSKQSFD
ncbi:MAG: M23 family metallopeptidase [Bacteroidetes bacterium]|nr:M23 family metallopeptidase [Bacteroidota bacterium]